MCTLVLNGRCCACNTLGCGSQLWTIGRSDSCGDWVLSPSQGGRLLGWHICPHRVCTLAELRSACRIPQQPAGCLERAPGESPRRLCTVVAALPSSAAVWACCPVACVPRFCAIISSACSAHSCHGCVALWTHSRTHRAPRHRLSVCFRGSTAFAAAQRTQLQPGLATRVFPVVCPSATARCA